MDPGVYIDPVVYKEPGVYTDLRAGSPEALGGPGVLKDQTSYKAQKPPCNFLDVWRAIESCKVTKIEESTQTSKTDLTLRRSHVPCVV